VHGCVPPRVFDTLKKAVESFKELAIAMASVSRVWPSLSPSYARHDRDSAAGVA
jgi:hypothetical protein